MSWFAASQMPMSDFYQVSTNDQKEACATISGDVLREAPAQGRFQGYALAHDGSPDCLAACAKKPRSNPLQSPPTIGRCEIEK